MFSRNKASDANIGIIAILVHFEKTLVVERISRQGEGGCQSLILERKSIIWKDCVRIQGGLYLGGVSRTPPTPPLTGRQELKHDLALNFICGQKHDIVVYISFIPGSGSILPEKKQECIPAGCVVPAAVAVSEGVSVIMRYGLLGVGLHWCVPFIEDLSETVQVVW